MSLDAAIVLQLGQLDLDVDLLVQPGELVALLGPNGAGKSTILRCLAGLSPIDRGRITIDGLVVDDPAAMRFVLPEQRHVGMVFQDYVLFEHMTVLENVAYSMRCRNVGRSHARRRAGEWLETVGLGPVAMQRPRTLSGGQAQRVALVRALASEPRVLLLDEPLAALDAASRISIRRDLRHHLRSFGGMRIMVTHDPVDAYALADRVAILDGGRIVQTGTLAEVTARPRSRYVAQLVGVNLVSGTCRNGVLVADGGVQVYLTDAADGAAFIAIRPRAVVLHRERPTGSARNVWPGVVAHIDPLGERVRVSLDGVLPLTAEITASSLQSLNLQPGDPMFASVKATDIEAYPA